MSPPALNALPAPVSTSTFAVRIMPYCVEERFELVVHLTIDCIQRIWPIHGCMQHLAVAVQKDRLEVG